MWEPEKRKSSRTTPWLQYVVAFVLGWAMAVLFLRAAPAIIKSTDPTTFHQYAVDISSGHVVPVSFKNNISVEFIAPPLQTENNILPILPLPEQDSTTATTPVPNYQEKPVARIALLFLTGKEGMTGLKTWTKWIEQAYDEEVEFGRPFVERHLVSDYAPPDWHKSTPPAPKRHECLMPQNLMSSFATSFQSIYDLPTKPRRCGKTPDRASIYTMVHGSENVDEGLQLQNSVFPNDPFNCTGVGPPHSKWGAGLSSVLRLYSAALEDPQNQFFIIISGTTLPVRPFSELYDFVMHKNRSLFGLMNSGLSNYGFKHHEWTILNRKHTEILVEDGTRSLLGPVWQKGAFATDEESRPAFILSMRLGEKQFWQEIYPETGRLLHVRQRRGLLHYDGGGYSRTDHDISMADESGFPTTMVSWEQWKGVQWDPNSLHIPLHITDIDTKSLFDRVDSIDLPYFFVRKVLKEATCTMRDQSKQHPVDDCFIAELQAQKNTYKKYRLN